jgi:hypothetical protein
MGGLLDQAASAAIFCGRASSRQKLVDALGRMIRQPRTYQFKVEQWDKTEDHIVWLIAISNNFLVARAAYEAPPFYEYGL